MKPTALHTNPRVTHGHAPRYRAENAEALCRNRANDAVAAGVAAAPVVGDNAPGVVVNDDDDGDEKRLCFSHLI